MKGRREPVYVPDGGWGWVIVACSFLIHMFVVGTLYALSVLYVSWLDAFHSGKGVTSWVISMAVAVMFGIGPLPASMSRRFGNRPVVMVGGIMMAGGFFVGSFAMNVYFLIVTVGLFAGVGAGCCYLPSVSLVAQYFTSKQSLAMGISASGLGVGAFFMAPFQNWLVEYFGWRGTMQILSGISLNMCVLASLMRPLESAPHCRNCKWLEESELTSEQQDMLVMATMGQANERDTGDGEKLGENDDERNYSPRKQESRIFSCACGKPNQSVIRMFDARTNVAPINYFPSPAVFQNVFSVPRSLVHKRDIKHRTTLRNTTPKEEVDEDIKPMKASSVLEVNTVSGPLRDIPQCSCVCRPMMNSEIIVGGSLSYSDIRTLPMGSLRRSFTFSHIPSPLVQTIKHAHFDNEQAESSITMPPIPISDSRYASNVTISSTSTEEEEGNSSFMCQDNEMPENCQWNKQIESSDFCGQRLQFCCALKSLKSAEIYIKLMHSKIFMVFCVSNLLTNLSFLMPVVYMVDRALDEGFGKREAAMLVSLYGTGNIFGKLFFGWLSDRKLLDRLLYYIGCLSMCGAATCASPLCGSSHTLHGLYSFTFGCFIGAYCTLFPLVTVDLVGMSVVQESFGMLLCFMGTATAFGTPLAGWIFDFTGSYTWAFFLHGAFILLSALMLIPILLKKKRIRNK